MNTKTAHKLLRVWAHAHRILALKREAFFACRELSRRAYSSENGCLLTGLPRASARGDSVAYAFNSVEKLNARALRIRHSISEVMRITRFVNSCVLPEKAARSALLEHYRRNTPWQTLAESYKTSANDLRLADRRVIQRIIRKAISPQ